jgi:hypothetical protein
MSEFSAFSVVDLGPIAGGRRVRSRDAMARTHFISNQQTSPTVLAKSTATCPKATRYRSGFMRIVTAASPLRQAVGVNFSAADEAT